jgi:hypothetical protein
MRNKAMSLLAALTLLALAPLAAQEAGYESELPPAPESEVTAEATPEPMAPEAIELDAANVPEPAATELETTTEFDADASEELPRTASPLALVALLGLGSAVSALGLRSVRRK